MRNASLFLLRSCSCVRVVSVRVPVYECVSEHVCMPVRTHVSALACVSVRVCVCARVYQCVCVVVCVCPSIQGYTPTTPTASELISVLPLVREGKRVEKSRGRCLAPGCHEEASRSLRAASAGVASPRPATDGSGHVCKEMRHGRKVESLQDEEPAY